jgi:GH15 family glucan-1,4-alpha-glucosidase
MYGPGGERRLTELELPWLAGYEASTPVRVGNAASGQFQLDVYGEVLDALHHACLQGEPFSESAWSLQTKLLDFVESRWRDPDEGIWEVRGPRQHFTHSKVMAWVAVDRAIQSAELFGLDAPQARWRALRDEIRADVLANGVDERGVLVQHYGTSELDASLLVVPLVGFLPPDDDRVRNTVEAIQRELVVDGFVLRYRNRPELDGLPAGEGAFLLCTFWLADNLAMQGREPEARAVYERLLALRNDVGLLAEQYDPTSKRQLGNFPQAFSHVALVNTATNLTDAAHGAARARSTRQRPPTPPPPPT